LSKFSLSEYADNTACEQFSPDLNDLIAFSSIAFILLNFFFKDIIIFKIIVEELLVIVESKQDFGKENVELLPMGSL